MLRDLHRNRESLNLEYLFENPDLCGRRFGITICFVFKSSNYGFESCKTCVIVMILKTVVQTQTGSEKDEGSGC